MLMRNSVLILLLMSSVFCQKSFSQDGDVSLVDTEAGAPLSIYPIQTILDDLENEKFLFIGQGVLYGYGTTSSCLYASEKILLVEHYCDAPHTPARSITLWSLKFGMVQLYGERFSNFDYRTIRLNEFATYLGYVFPDNARSLTVDRVNEMMRILYEQKNPACWSSNADFSTAGSLANCLKADAQLFEPWFKETQGIVNSPLRWNKVYLKLMEAIGS